ncbi:exosortase [Reinekea sp.]|uniref:exosortase n=1 Tax=Reinekea sp. TaxID=1970455 RepID=UPI002A80695E|nr:exosortase [Reinekea sp.]
MRFRLPSSIRPLALLTQWLPLLPLLSVFSLVLWTLQDTLISLHQRWTQWHGPYSHGYLLVLVCLLFIFRDLQAKLPFSKACWSYVPLVLVPSLIWSFGHATQIGLLQQMALPALLAALILPTIGLKRFISQLFALALLYLAIPLWEILLPVLRTMTNYMATLGVRLVGVPAYIDGFSFSLPHGTVVIAGSCAGLSYLLMGLVLAGINSRYRHFSLKHCLWSIGLMSLLAIVGNWLRVFSLILIAFYSDMEHPLVREHGNYGWWLFSGVFMLFLWLIRHYPEGTPPEPSRVVTTKLTWPIRASLVLLITGALGLALPLWLLSQAAPAPDAERSLVDSAVLPGWLAVPAEVANRQYRSGYSGYDRAHYWQTQLAGKTWLIGQLVYQQQQQGKELISASNSLTQGQDQPSVLAFLTGNSALEAVLIAGKTPRLLVYTHQIGKRLELGAVHGKLAQFSELLAGRPVVAFWYATTTCSSYQCQAELATLNNNPRVIPSWLAATTLY